MSSADKDKNPLEGLADAFSDMNMGPAWARSREDNKKPDYKKFEKAAERESRSGGRNDRRGGGGRGQQQRGERRGTGGRRDGGDRRERQGSGGGQRDRAPRRPQIEAPAHIEASVMPTEAAVDVLAAQITGSGRTWSVFDQARAILEERERFHVIFQSTDEEKSLHFCPHDRSLWLTRDEAAAHITKADWLGRYYEISESKVEPPKGSFTAVAKCGFSGELLGPPNFHGYQERLREKHRTEFANLDFDRYRGRVETVQGEEIVAEWLESMNQRKVFVPRTEPLSNEDFEKLEASTEVLEEAPEGALQSLVEVQKHFLENHFDQAFEKRRKAWVPSSIEAKLLSPGLLAALKELIQNERRYPAKLSAFLCRQFTGRRLAAFKFQGKLKCGPSRPKAIPADANYAERPSAMIDWIRKNDGKSLAEMQAALIAESATEEDKKAWDADLKWLLKEGFVILLPSLELFIAKKGESPKEPAA